jgi:hypothetical protein
VSSIKEDLRTIESALANANPGVMLREAAKTALGRIKEHVAFDRTQREFMEADFKALAEGKPVKTALAKAVEARIETLRNAERDREEDELFKSDWRAEPGTDAFEESVATAGAYVAGGR